MASIAGRKCTVYVSTDNDSTYDPIAGIASVDGGQSAAPIDDSEFGIEWMQKVTGILDNKASLSGQFHSDDADGQIAIRGAMIAGDFIWFKILFDGTSHGWKQKMIVTSFGGPVDVKDLAKLKIDLEGSGAVTFLP